MKEKIKVFLFNVSIFYSIVIVALMLFSYFSAKTKIELFDLEKNIERLNELKKEVALLKNNSCTDSINDLIKGYEATSYDGEVDLREWFNYSFDDDYFESFSNVKETCNLTGDDMLEYDFPYNLVGRNILNDEIFNKYFYQYELGVKDFILRITSEPVLISSEYILIKRAELNVISDVIDVVIKNEKNNTVIDDEQSNKEDFDDEQ